MAPKEGRHFLSLTCPYPQPNSTTEVKLKDWVWCWNWRGSTHGHVMALDPFPCWGRWILRPVSWKMQAVTTDFFILQNNGLGFLWGTRATWCYINFITHIIITPILIWFKNFIGPNCSSYECLCYFLPFLISIKNTDLCFLIIENDSCLMDSCIHMEFQSLFLTLRVSVYCQLH